MGLVAWLSVVVFVGTYVVIAVDRLPRAAVALTGAGLMLLIGAEDARSAFFSQETGVDWTVLLLLLGMMIIVGVLRHTGVYEWLALWSARRAGGRPFVVMVLLVVITAAASTLLNNVTTLLLIAPVTLSVCELLEVDPVPFLIAEAMASNIGGTATLIGDPPNLIIGERAGLSFTDFLVHLAPIIAVLTVVFVLLCRVMFARTLVVSERHREVVRGIDLTGVIRDPRLLRRCAIVLAAVVAGFLVPPSIGFDPAVVALLGAGALVLWARVPTERYLGDVEWETLVFFTGLFIMVGGLVNTGVIAELSSVVVAEVDGRFLAASTGLLFGSAVLSAVVDNIPYVATMAPLVSDLVASGPGEPGVGSLWWSLALGADLGGNATAVGASANVVAIGIAATAGHPISFWRFTKYGLIVTAVTVGLCWPYIWLRYFVLGG